MVSVKQYFTQVSILISALFIGALIVCCEQIIDYDFDAVQQLIKQGAQIKELVLADNYRVIIKPYTGWTRYFFTGAELTLQHHGKTVAFVDADYIIKRYGFGWDLWVVPKFRGHGYGTLIGKVAAWYLKMIGCKTAVWIAQPSGSVQEKPLTIHELADGYKKHGGTERLRISFLNISLFSLDLASFEPDVKIQQIVINY